MDFTLGRIVNRNIVVVERHASAATAAQVMRQYHVGAVVVVAPGTGQGGKDGARPEGIVTDRDLVLEILAQEADPQLVTVGDLLDGRLISLGENESVFEAIALMRREGVRRLVVMDGAGGLAGLVSMDDMLALLSAELLTLARVIPAEIGDERRRRPGNLEEPKP